MAILPIRQFGDQALRQVTHEIKEIDSDIKTLVKNLADTMYQARGLGLSANQVGILLKIFVFDDSAQGENLKAYANPQITERKGAEEDEEGCLSLDEIRLPVKRAKEVTVKAIDISSGEEVVVHAKDLLARIFQHEIDHLNGKLIVDRTSQDLRKQALKQLSMAGLPKL